MIRGKDITREETAGRARFFGEYYKKEPVILSGYLSHWPATKKWSLEYFKEAFGGTKVWLDFYDSTSEKSSLDHHIEWNLKEITLTEYIDSILAGERCYSLREDQELFDELPELVEDLGDLSPFSNREEFEEDDYKGLWLAGPQHVTALHIDIGEGHLFHLHGKKRFLFFDPEQTGYLYEEDKSKLRDPSLSERIDEEELEIWKKYMRWSQVNPLRPDYEKFPLLKQAVFREAVLEAGDVMYVPSGWWHVVESLTPTIGVTLGLQEHLILLDIEESNKPRSQEAHCA